MAVKALMKTAVATCSPDSDLGAVVTLMRTGSEAAFTTGWMQLFQVVFARGSSNAIPWTRLHQP